ncbi:MAG: hypothetical protein BWZ02_00691 [Lentisphaerae bacterium ADurb.BinA184]|nr:MAG: hypothetical protein BWZ02_00691 [Lentisphaerae bacterium ADurb.BinA184]
MNEESKPVEPVAAADTPAPVIPAQGGAATEPSPARDAGTAPESGSPAPGTSTAGKTVRLAPGRAGQPAAVSAAMSPEMRARRAQLAQEKAKIHAVLKRRVWLITGLLNVSCAVVLVCVYLLAVSRRMDLTLVVLGVLALDLALLGYLVLKVYGYYRTGQQAIAEHRRRQRQDRARKLMEQFGGKLSTATQEALLEFQAQPEPAEEVEPDTVTEAMYLQLKGDELSNALQFLCMTSRRGHLALAFPDGRTGDLYLGNGTIQHAETGGKAGIEAVAMMLREPAVEARFFEGRRWPRQTLGQAASQILIEASVMGDEMAAGGAQP